MKRILNLFKKKKCKEEINKRYNKALELFSKGKHKESIKILKRIIENYKNKSNCYHYIALNYGKLYEFKKADKYFDLALKAYDSKNKKAHNDDKIFFNKGLTIYFSNYKEDKSAYEKALDLIVKAMEKNPKIPIYHYYKALIFYKLKRYKSAKKIFNAAKYFNKGPIENYENIGKFDEWNKEKIMKFG